MTAAKAPLADKATAVKVKEFNADVQRAAAQPNAAAPSILTKTQMPGTSKTTNAQKLMDNIANGDASTIRAALVENIATDPSSLYKAMTVAAVKSEPETVAKAFQRLEEANQIYVKAANDLVKDVVDSGQGATRLAELSNSLGDAPVIKMLDTAMGMGETGARIEPTPLINEITNIRREWETLRKIESTPTTAAPTGATHITSPVYDLKNAMSESMATAIQNRNGTIRTKDQVGIWERQLPGIKPTSNLAAVKATMQDTTIKDALKAFDTNANEATTSESKAVKLMNEVAGDEPAIARAILVKELETDPTRMQEIWKQAKNGGMSKETEKIVLERSREAMMILGEDNIPRGVEALVEGSKVRDINNLHDVAALTDDEIDALARAGLTKRIQDTNGRWVEEPITSQDLQNARTKAQETLSSTKLDEATELEDYVPGGMDETGQTSWSLGLKDKKLDDEYKALYSADNLKSQATAKRGDIEKLQNAAQKSIGRPLDTMDDFKSLTNKEIDALSKNVPSVSKSDITGYRVQATKEMDKLSQVRQTYDKLGTEDYTNLVKLQQQRAADLASTADEYRNLLRNTERTADQERRMGQLGVRLEEQRSILQATTEAIDARKMQMEQWKTKQLTAADIKPGTKDRKTAAINAIDAAKKGDYETAIKKFAEARTHDGRSVLSKVDAKHYDGMSIQRINRMEEAVPADQMSKGMKEMLERMRQERRDFAIDALSKKGDDFKRAAFKIKNGDELDELERLKLWNSGDEIRTLAKDALDDVNGNKLVKGLVDDAVKKGDAARAKNLKTSMKEELEKCIKRGECGGGAAAATAAARAGKTLNSVGGSMAGLGILAAAGLNVGMVNTADGKMYKHDSKTNTFYEIVPDNTIKEMSPFDYNWVEVGYKQLVTDDAVGAYNALKNAGILDKTYSWGEDRGVQGRNVDKTEYVCQNYVIDGVNAINRNSDRTGIVAKAVNVLGTFNDGKSVNHSLIALENRNVVLGTYTDETTGETRNIYKTTLIEPQTGESSAPGWDFSGKTMALDGKEYKIETIQTMDNARQEQGTVFHEDGAYLKGDNVTMYSTGEKETQLMADTLEQDLKTVATAARENVKAQISDTYKIDPWQTTSDLDTEVK